MGLGSTLRLPWRRSGSSSHTSHASHAPHASASAPPAIDVALTSPSLHGTPTPPVTSPATTRSASRAASTPPSSAATSPSTRVKSPAPLVLAHDAVTASASASANANGNSKCSSSSSSNHHHIHNNNNNNSNSNNNNNTSYNGSNGSSSSNPPRYGYTPHHLGIRLSPAQVTALIELAQQAIVLRGLQTPLLFSSLCLELHPSSTTSLIRAYLGPANTPPASPHQPLPEKFVTEVQFAQPADLAALVKWALGRIFTPLPCAPGPRSALEPAQRVRGFLSLDTYLSWRQDEQADNYPSMAYTELEQRLAPDTAALLRQLLSLLSSTAAHALQNGMTPAWLARHFGPLVFGLPEDDTFTRTYLTFVRTTNATEHLLLAYIRHTGVKLERKGASLPLRLAQAIAGYPGILASNLDHLAPATGRSVPLTVVERSVKSYAPDLLALAQSFELPSKCKEWDACHCLDPRDAARWGAKPQFSTRFRKLINYQGGIQVPPVTVASTSPASTGSSSGSTTPTAGTASHSTFPSAAGSEKENRVREWGSSLAPSQLPSGTSSTRPCIASNDNNPLNTGSRKGSQGLSVDPATLPASLADKMWSDFASSGFDQGDPSKFLTFDLHESARKQWASQPNEAHAKQWGEFAASGFESNQLGSDALSAALAFDPDMKIAPARGVKPEEAKAWERELARRRKLLLAQPAFPYDSKPRVMASPTTCSVARTAPRDPASRPPTSLSLPAVSPPPTSSMDEVFAEVWADYIWCGGWSHWSPAVMPNGICSPSSFPSFPSPSPSPSPSPCPPSPSPSTPMGTGPSTSSHASTDTGTGTEPNAEEKAFVLATLNRRRPSSWVIVQFSSRPSKWAVGSSDTTRTVSGGGGLMSPWGGSGGADPRTDAAYFVFSEVVPEAYRHAKELQEARRTAGKWDKVHNVLKRHRLGTRGGTKDGALAPWDNPGWYHRSGPSGKGGKDTGSVSTGGGSSFKLSWSGGGPGSVASSSMWGRTSHRLFPSSFSSDHDRNHRGQEELLDEMDDLNDPFRPGKGGTTRQLTLLSDHNDVNDPAAGGVQRGDTAEARDPTAAAHHDLPLRGRKVGGGQIAATNKGEDEYEEVLSSHSGGYAASLTPSQKQVPDSTSSPRRSRTLSLSRTGSLLSPRSRGHFLFGTHSETHTSSTQTSSGTLPSTPLSPPSMDNLRDMNGRHKSIRRMGDNLAQRGARPGKSHLGAGTFELPIGGAGAGAGGGPSLPTSAFAPVMSSRTTETDSASLVASPKTFAFAHEGALPI